MTLLLVRGAVVGLYLIVKGVLFGWRRRPLLWLAVMVAGPGPIVAYELGGIRWLDGYLLGCVLLAWIGKPAPKLPPTPARRPQ